MQNQDRSDPRPPRIAGHALIKRIGHGTYGDVWLARNVFGTLRAVKIIYRDRMCDQGGEGHSPFDRALRGVREYEPVSRQHEGLVHLLQVEQDDTQGFFYYVMEAADDAHHTAGQSTASPSSTQAE